MAEAATKLPIKTETTPAPQITKASDRQPFEALRNQVDRLFHDFQTGFLQAPSYRSPLDIERERPTAGSVITPWTWTKTRLSEAELPGIDVRTRPSAFRQHADNQG